MCFPFFSCSIFNFILQWFTYINLELLWTKRVQVHFHYFFFDSLLLFILTCIVLQVPVESVAASPFSFDTPTFQYLYLVHVIVSIWSTYTKKWYFLQSGPWSCKVSERYIIRLFQDHKGNFDENQQDHSPEKGKKSSFFYFRSTDSRVVFVPRNWYNDAFFSSAGLRSWWSW